MRLGDRSWPEIAGRAGSSLLAVPIGSTEQHGPHLPLSTDAEVAAALADRLAGQRPDVLVAPTLAYGASGEHAAFAGTLSIGRVALELVLVELVRSADAFSGVVLVNGHGGNVAAAAAAVDRLAAEGRAVLAWSPHVAGGDAHAGRTETSLMLALRPAAVRMASAQPGNLAPLPDLLENLQADGVAAVSGNGVLGDPTDASADEGGLLLDHLAADLLAAVQRRWASG
jgi:creatinine amidohydrolase